VARARTALAATAVLAVAAILIGTPGTAGAARAANTALRIGGVPQQLDDGGNAQLAAVVAQRGGPLFLCQRVRFALVADVTGLDVDQLRVTRVENGDDFPVRLTREGNRLQLVDGRDDDGRLCFGRTVTADYRLSVDRGASSGQISLRVSAFAEGDQLLATDAATITVRGQAPAATPPPSPTDTASPSPTPEDTDTPSSEPSTPIDESESTPAGASLPTGDPTASGAVTRSAVTLPTIGFGFGAVLLLVGLAVLLNLYRRRRAAGPPGEGNHRGRRRRPLSFTPPSAGQLRALVRRDRGTPAYDEYDDYDDDSYGRGPASGYRSGVPRMGSPRTRAVAAPWGRLRAAISQLNGRLVQRTRRL